jgi:hypothetical protein
MFALFVEPEVRVEPEPESWRFRVESNLTSRDSLRGLRVGSGRRWLLTAFMGRGIVVPQPKPSLRQARTAVEKGDMNH